jgi:RNA polymerase sigma-70 factor, ECF subfamily
VRHFASSSRPGLILYKGKRRLAAGCPGLSNSITTPGANVTNRSGEDRTLIERASRGDVKAFAQLVQNYSRLVYRVALRILGDQDAQDASQEVWIRVWRNIKRFRGESAFTTWLYKITVNTCLSERRKQLKRPTYEFGEELSYLPVLPDNEGDPEASALTIEHRQELLDALKRVRVEHRAALVLRHMEGLSYAEIAQILDVPVGTAKGWVSRGRATLLVALSEEGYERGNAEGAVE